MHRFVWEKQNTQTYRLYTTTFILVQIGKKQGYLLWKKTGRCRLTMPQYRGLNQFEENLSISEVNFGWKILQNCQLSRHGSALLRRSFRKTWDGQQSQVLTLFCFPRRETEKGEALCLCKFVYETLSFLWGPKGESRTLYSALSVSKVVGHWAQD